jgi:hypothetical protein
MEPRLETPSGNHSGILHRLRGTFSVTCEEGTWAAWVYDLLKPHVDELVVCNPRKNARLKDGNKSDRIDARKLVDRLRLNDLNPFYHAETGVRMLRELARSYLNLVKDQTRVMNRLKRCIAVGRFAVRVGKSTMPAISPSGWERSARPAYGVGPSTTISNWTCCNTCASKLRENCWRKVASIPSPPSYGIFRRSAPFAGPWRWLSIQTPHRFRTKRLEWARCGCGHPCRPGPRPPSTPWRIWISSKSRATSSALRSAKTTTKQQSQHRAVSIRWHAISTSTLE